MKFDIAEIIYDAFTNLPAKPPIVDIGKMERELFETLSEEQQEKFLNLMKEIAFEHNENEHSLIKFVLSFVNATNNYYETLT